MSDVEHHVFVGYLYVFFGEMSVWVFHPFFDWVVCFFDQDLVHDGEGNGTPLQYSCLENPMDGLQSMGWLRVVHDSVTSLSLFTFMLWRRKWQPTPVLLPGESWGWWSLVGCRLWGCKESDMTEAT